MKIYIIGDSISIQYGPYLAKYLNGLIEYSRKEGEEEALLNLDIPQGANGGDSAMALTFLKSKLEAGGINADLLLVNCGLHDIKTNPDSGFRQVTIDQYKDNLKGIVDTSKALECPLAWIRTTPCEEDVHNHNRSSFHRFSEDCVAYNEIADQVMKSSGVPIIDLYSFTLNIGKDLYCDHVHFHDHVREKQASFLAGWLMSYQGTA